MNKLRILAVSGAMLLSYPAPGWPQAQHVLRVKAVNEFDRPLSGISFRIAFVGDYRSDANGEYLANLPVGMGPGQPIEFNLRNDTLAIFEPARGRDKVPDREAVVLKLLPKGDHRFLNRNEMKALMNDLINDAVKKESQHLQAQVMKLEQQLASVPQDPLPEEAKRLGFTKEELLTAIEKIKEQLRTSEDSYEVGLAALYDKHYGQAKKLITESIAQDEKFIRAAEVKKEKLPEKWLNLGNARAGENDLAGAISAYEYAIQLQPTNAKAYLQLGSIQYIKGEYRNVMINLRKALTLFNSHNLGQPTVEVGNALGNLGMVFRGLGQTDSAFVYLQAALKNNRKIGHRHGEANDLSNLGMVFDDWGQIDSARVYYQAALSIYREISDRKGEASTLIHLGGRFEVSGESDSANIYYQAALKINREIGYRQGEASALIRLGGIFYYLGQPDSARAYSQIALKINREFGYRGSETVALGELGRLFNYIGQIDSARIYYQAALKIAREIGSRRGEAYNLGSLGGLFHISGNFGDARVYYQAALKINREISDRLSEANSLVNLGITFQALGKSDEAFVYYLASLKIHREIGHPSGEAYNLYCLGALFNNLGQPDSAMIYYQAALKIDHKIGNRLGEAIILESLGRLHKNSGQLDQARVYLMQSLKIREEIKSPYQQRVAKLLDEMNTKVNQRWLNIGENKVKKGQLDSAKIYYNLALQDSRNYSYRAGELLALSKLSLLFHEKQFNYLEAFAIVQQWLKVDSANTSVQAEFAEKLFTTSRFAECEERIAGLLANPEVEPHVKIALRAIVIANLLALNQSQAVPMQWETLQVAIAGQPSKFKVGWAFKGTKHFISQNEKLAPYRDWLLQLLSSLEKKDRKEISAALKKVKKYDTVRK